MWGSCAWFLSAIHFVSFWKRRLLEHKASKKAWWIVGIDQKETSFYYLIYCIYSMLWINRWCPQGHYCTKKVQNKKNTCLLPRDLMLMPNSVIHMGSSASGPKSKFMTISSLLPTSTSSKHSHSVSLMGGCTLSCHFPHLRVLVNWKLPLVSLEFLSEARQVKSTAVGCLNKTESVLLKILAQEF